MLVAVHPDGEENMRRELLLSLIIAGATLCAQPPTPTSQPPTSQAPSGNPNPGLNRPDVMPPDSAPPRIDDKKFVKDAALGGMTEVELGKLAAQKASSDPVKQFGQKLVDDHGKVNDELKQIAGQQSIKIPDSLDSKHQSRVDKLAKLSGPEFDKAFIKEAVKNHQQDVSEFQQEASSGTDPNVRSFAIKTLPALQAHLSTAKDLEKETKAAK
jgi:putative membrane protein